ncbi:GNAT family N-acetyltransferase [Rhodanobacter lindaniclasticus]
MTVTIRKAEASDAAGVSRLILGLVGFFLSNTSSRTANSSWRRSRRKRSPNVLARLTVIWRTRWPLWIRRPAGWIHLHHLFVRSGCHRQGIARALWQQVRTQSDSSTFAGELVSSTLAVPVYERLGFVATGAAQVAHGLAFVPMAA